MAVKKNIIIKWWKFWVDCEERKECTNQGDVSDSERQLRRRVDHFGKKIRKGKWGAFVGPSVMHSIPLILLLLWVTLCQQLFVTRTCSVVWVTQNQKRRGCLQASSSSTLLFQSYWRFRNALKKSWDNVLFLHKVLARTNYFSFF